LADCLLILKGKDPDFALVFERWRGASEAVKAAIVGLMKATSRG